MINILLSSFNGQRYLHEQLSSLSAQTSDKSISFLFRDDGSSDESFDILQAFASKTTVNAILLENTVNFGIKKSFETLLYQALQSDTEHIMFCDQVVIVSASLGYWLRPLCDQNNLELIATKLEILEGKVTGNLLTKNCYGIEKVNRIKEIYALEDFETIYAYGDSRGDREMLKIAHKASYKPFR